MPLSRRFGFMFGISALLAVAVAQDKPADEPKRRTDLEKRDLKAPEGVMVTEIKLPKGVALHHYWNTGKVGDWAEYQVAGGLVSRREIADLTDDGMIELNSINVAGMQIRTGLKFLFTQPDPIVDKKAVAPEVKKTKERVKVGDKELDCEVTELEVAGGKARSWMSKEVPLGGLVKAEFGGMVSMQLKAFGRGK